MNDFVVVVCLGNPISAHPLLCMITLHLEPKYNTTMLFSLSIGGTVTALSSVSTSARDQRKSDALSLGATLRSL
jgi:hypothetical protein